MSGVLGTFCLICGALKCKFLREICRGTLCFRLVRRNFGYRIRGRVGMFCGGRGINRCCTSVIVGGSVVLRLGTTSTLHPRRRFRLVGCLGTASVRVNCLLGFKGRPRFGEGVFDRR